MRIQKQFSDVFVKLELRQDFTWRNFLFNFIFGESSGEGDGMIILYPAMSGSRYASLRNSESFAYCLGLRMWIIRVYIVFRCGR